MERLQSIEGKVEARLEEALRYAAARRAETYVRGVFRVLRPGGVLFVVSFSETRLRHLKRAPWASHTVDTLRNERNQAVHVYVLRKPRRRRFVLGAVLAALAYATHRHVRTRAVVAAEDLEPTAGAAQCNYELLKSFTRVAAGLDWTLGAGTLLGALRSEPAGLLPWEHDVDVYIPARDAAALGAAGPEWPEGTARDLGELFVEHEFLPDPAPCRACAGVRGLAHGLGAHALCGCPTSESHGAADSSAVRTPP